MKKLTVVLSVAVVVAFVLAGVAGMFGGNATPSVYASRLAGIKAAGATGIQVQNLDASQQATVVADFYKQTGGAAIPINLPPIAPLSAYNIYLPQQTALTNGAYAAIISGDRQLAAIARTEWQSSGGAALYSNVSPSTTVALPLATKGFVGQTSLISIQNTDPNQQASVTVKLFASGQTAAVMTKQYNIEKGTSITLDLGTNDDFAALPTPFLGSVTVESATPVGVQSFIDFENSEKAVYAFEGVPSEQAAAKLYAPLFRNEFFGTTGISVVNPGTSAVQVTVKFAGSLGAGCTGQNFSQGPATIAAGSSVVFYQGNAAVPGSGTSPLPKNCAGSATIESTGGNILAIVNDASGNPGNPTTSAAYNAVSDDQGAKKVALPLYRKDHTSAKISTGIQAMNIGTDTARANIKFTYGTTTIEGANCQGGCSATIAPGASANWYPPTMAALAAGQYGSAFIDSDQPLAVIVNDASSTGAFDAAIYNGIKADVQ